MNKKLSLARRITGQVAAENVVAPLTGEILILSLIHISTTGC